MMLNPSRIRNSHTHPVHRYKSKAPKSISVAQKAFQRKYTLFLMISIFGMVAMFFGVAYYQIHQNYEIFKKLAFETNPHLVHYLEREMNWFSVFLIASLGSIFSFCLIIGLRMTGNVIKPLIRMERHMKKVSRGDWSSNDFYHHQKEDLAEFLDSYSYLYRSLRAHTEHEIKLLEKLVIDPNNREAISIWKTLVIQKRKQLDMPIEVSPISETSASTLPPRESRHAS